MLCNVMQYMHTRLYAHTRCTHYAYTYDANVQMYFRASLAYQVGWETGRTAKAYKMKVMGVVGRGSRPQIRAIEPGDVAGI